MSNRTSENFITLFYALGVFGTFIYLTFFDGYIYNAWNWIIAIPVNVMLSGIFPIYWLVLHWLF